MFLEMRQTCPHVDVSNISKDVLNISSDDPNCSKDV